MHAEKTRRPGSEAPDGLESCDREGENGICPVLAAVSVIGTEWRLAIVHRLLEGPQRFSEILKSNARLNAKTLSATLKFLEGQGVVQRTVVSTRPFSVVYSLTDMGLGLAPAARELRLWGTRWLLPRRQAALRAGAAARRTPVIEGELPRLAIPESDPRGKA
jgi:DNA-binding HxlR family transcriptional regulator